MRATVSVTEWKLWFPATRGSSWGYGTRGILGSTAAAMTLSHQLRIGVTQARQIRGARRRVPFAQHAVVPVAALETRDQTALVGDVAELNRLRRAGLLTRGHHLPFPNG